MFWFHFFERFPESSRLWKRCDKTFLMNPLIWLISALVLIIPALIRHIVWRCRQYREFVRLVDKLPGPSALPILGSALKFSPDSEKSTYQMEYYFRKYTFEGGGGPDTMKGNPGIMRLWIGPKPIVIFWKPESAKAILESNVLITKPFEYSLLQDWLGTGLLTSTGEKWQRRRKLLTPAFHFKILANFIQVFNRQSNVLVEKLDECAQNEYPFDFYRMIKLYALDIICEAAMGTQLNALRGGNPKYVEAVKKMCELSFLRMRSPWLWPAPVWWLSGKGGEFARNLRAITEFTQGVIACRKRERAQTRQQNGDGMDGTNHQNDSNNNNANKSANADESGKPAACFLDILLGLQEQNNFSDEDIREEVETFMFEGHDTVASSVGFTVFSLGHRPAVQARLHAEMDHLFGEYPERDITYDDLPRMRYTEQCVRETMRLLPSVPLIGRDITEATEICGFTIPAGCTAMVAPFSIHRDKRYYHAPDDYDPEHFSEENVLRRNKEPFAYLPFSAGPRNCIGQKFAGTEQKISLAKIFRRFRIISVQHELESRGLPELVLKPSDGFWIRIERR
uniref:Cytochrome P450 n=1 Tax=Globodera rostochiensis TaxID=31243 RepID=A0A914HG35_GLORO